MEGEAVMSGFAGGAFDGLEEVCVGFFRSGEGFGLCVVSIWPFEDNIWCSFLGEVWLEFGMCVYDCFDDFISVWIVLWAVWVFGKVWTVGRDVFFLKWLGVVGEAVCSYFIFGEVDEVQVGSGRFVELFLEGSLCGGDSALWCVCWGGDWVVYACGCC